MECMWTNDDVAKLTSETTAGSLHWHGSINNARRVDRDGGALTLHRDKDGRITLTTIDTGQMQVVVLAESVNPPMAPALAELWEAASGYSAVLRRP